VLVYYTKKSTSSSSSSSPSSSHNYCQLIWLGHGCESVEKELAEKTAESMRKGKQGSVKVVNEGSEPEEFWTYLGGKKPYASSSELRCSNTMAKRPPRVFHCWNAKGYFDLEEIYNFTQDDLLLEDIYILDVYTSVFVWVGTDANDEEKRKSFETAVKYVERASKFDGRSVDVPIIKVLAGEEPPMFTCWFHAWEPLQAGVDIFKQFQLQQIQKENIKTHQLDRNNSDVRLEVKQLRTSEQGRHVIFPYEAIRLDLNKKKLPKNVDLKNMEKHLTDQEFEKVFSMKRDAFNQIPVWKQENIKSALYLF